MKYWSITDQQTQMTIKITKLSISLRASSLLPSLLHILRNINHSNNVKKYKHSNYVYFFNYRWWHISIYITTMKTGGCDITQISSSIITMETNHCNVTRVLCSYKAQVLHRVGMAWFFHKSSLNSADSCLLGYDMVCVTGKAVIKFCSTVYKIW
jgi:hypothetical protein